MPRTLNAKTLNDYLSAAHMTVMLCRAHGDSFDLNPEEVDDANWRIELHIAELEGLRDDLTPHNAASGGVADDAVVVRLPVSGRARTVPGPDPRAC